MGKDRISPAPLRSPMFDAAGVLTRPWQVWFGEVFIRAAAEADTEVLDAYYSHGTDDEQVIRQSVEASREPESGRNVQELADIQAVLAERGKSELWRSALADSETGIAMRRDSDACLDMAAQVERLLAHRECCRRSAEPDAEIRTGARPPAPDDWPAMLAWSAGPRDVPVMLVSGTHAERAGRPAGAYAPGTVYYETDRALYYIAIGAAWLYLAGIVRTASISAKPADLGATDAGVLWYSEDYRHLWRWTGTGWEYAPGDRRSGEVAHFTEAPGAGWALCDGSSATRTYSDGTTGLVTLPNLIDSYIKGAAAYDAQVHAASGGTFTGNPLPAHKHATPFVLTGTGRLVWKSWRWGGYSSEWLTGGYQITGGAQNPNGEQLWWDAVSPDSAGTPSGTVSPGDVQHVHLMPYFRL